MTFNEYDIINYLKKNNLNSSVVGIGDDCAVIPKDKKSSWLVTSDSFVEAVHFRTNFMSASQIAMKLLTVNISDICAMGGKADYVLLNLSLPKKLPSDWLEEFLEAFTLKLKEYNVLLIGGDTTVSLRDIHLNLTVIGSCSNSHIKYRSKAQLNDIICVTGCLGNSSAGLRCLEEKYQQSEYSQKLIQSYQVPTINPDCSSWFGSLGTIHSMIDISDGLFLDLRKLTEASKCGAKISVEKIPISAELDFLSDIKSWNKYEIAISGGEDYGLLLTMNPTDFKDIAYQAKHQFNVALTHIGEIKSIDRNVEYRLYNNHYSFNNLSYEHFND